MGFTVEGYKFNNESAVVAAQNQARNAHGLPVSPDSVTTEWVSYFISYTEQVEIDFYYVLWDSSLPPLFGQPTTFEINTEEQ